VNFKKICVLGLGSIGLPTASTSAACGLQVVGVDVNPQVLATLRIAASTSISLVCGKLLQQLL
jgi:UDP-N-acetyl-D-mannosaminuronate dehydrogenase